MQPEDMPFGFDVRQWELDLPIDPSGTNECGVERLDAVRGHDDFDVTSSVEPVQLVEKFQHCTLDFALAAGGGVIPVRAGVSHNIVVMDILPTSSFQWHQSRR